MTTRVAVLGTGKMGSALARRLAESGFEPTLWNRTRSRAEQVGVGRVVDTPADAVRAADVVISNLTGPDAVRATYGGPQGAIAGASGQLFVEMSTAGPDVLAELAPQLAATGSALVDAPIVGVPPVVLRGAAALLAGGTPADVERARRPASMRSTSSGCWHASCRCWSRDAPASSTVATNPPSSPCATCARTSTSPSTSSAAAPPTCR
jgi:3-hydroxyisobutyrate dehydrogenase-like beta-hydroxyacid dehydrogenase